MHRIRLVAVVLQITNKEVHWESVSIAFSSKNEALEKGKQLAEQARYE